jgi:hypothetical protein
VLSLLDTLPGLRFSPAGDAFDTINGVGMNSLNATRDGMSIINNRYDVQSDGRNVLSSTTLLPDLIGEIRLIVSPADAELGRGNAQVQISTRSGTNRYTGAASGTYAITRWTMHLDKQSDLNGAQRLCLEK